MYKLPFGIFVGQIYFHAPTYRQIQKIVCASGTTSCIAGGCFSNPDPCGPVYLFRRPCPNSSRAEKYLDPATRERVVASEQTTLECCLRAVFTLDIRELRRRVKIWFLAATEKKTGEQPSIVVSRLSWRTFKQLRI